MTEVLVLILLWIKLMSYHSVDIQWGNHDILWMGAAAGQWGCIANVIRICARYGNLDILRMDMGSIFFLWQHLPFGFTGMIRVFVFG